MISSVGATPKQWWRGCVLVFACGLVASPLGSQVIQLRDSRPVVRIEPTTAGGDSVVFGTVVGATRLSDGTIVVADPLTPAILYFDRSARLLSVTGRRGGGPGEFGRIRWIGQCARDTVFAFEQARIQVFTNRGKVVRTIDAGGHLPGQLFCTRSGVIAAVGAGDWSVPGAPGVRRVRAQAWTFGTDGRLRREVGTIPVIDAAWDGGVWQPTPLGRQMFLSFDGADLIMGDGESATLASFSPSGTWKTGPSLGAIAARKPTDDDVDAGILALLALAPNRQSRAIHDIFARLPRPDAMPPYHRVMADGAGRVWVQLSVVGTAPTRLRWVDRKTGRTGDLTIAAALVLQEVGPDYLLALEELPSGEQRVVEYALIER